MKSRKHNDISHINNIRLLLAGRLKQDLLPVQCLTAGAATLPSTGRHVSHTQTIMMTVAANSIW